MIDQTTREEQDRQRREAHNRKLRTQLVEARETGDGYVRVYLGGAKVHAAKTETRGWGGFVHPRALCQPHTPRSYGSVFEDPSKEITCGRCLASIAKDRS